MITDSRLRKGTLTLGSESTGSKFACQATNVRVVTNFDDDGDDLETLCGDVILAGQKDTYTLAGTSVQDFDDPDGFMAFCWDNSMKTVPFTWKANADAAPDWAGNVRILALEEGGDVNARLTADWEFACVGKPTRTYGVAPAAPPTVSSIEPAEADAGDTVTITGDNLAEPSS